MDTTQLRSAYHDFLAVAEAGGFGPPPPGEWDAEHVLAHVAAVDASVAAVAMSVASGQRPSYDNRTGLDPWNLRRIIAAAGGDLPGLTRRVRRTGELLCAIAEELSEDDLAVQLATLIISNDEVVVDQPWTLGVLVGGIGRVHLPGHAEQLGALRAPRGTATSRPAAEV
ncbi:MAG TPA: hypothetical protein VFU43_24120 [Streptosporangiaceae bacterium]|nr:hypothetical protein [Streptosporangiaceae bacterium]